MGLSGLTGKPENPETFVCFQDDDIQIYLARETWEALAPETEKLLIAIQEYGRFWLWFGDRPKKQEEDKQ
jgi:hypothetical protein